MTWPTWAVCAVAVGLVWAYLAWEWFLIARMTGWRARRRHIDRLLDIARRCQRPKRGGDYGA